MCRCKVRSVIRNYLKGHALMIKLESNKMQRAIERAKAVRPRVTVINADERTYSVSGSRGNQYTVRFVVVNGLKLAECDCKAGQAGQSCYHVAGAAQVNVMVQSMRRQKPAAVPVLAPKSADERGALIESITSTWSRRFPVECLADNLMARFRVNALSLLNTDFLRRVLAAIA